MKIPNTGYCIAASYGERGYHSCYKTRSSARRAAVKLRRKNGGRVDIVRVTNGGEDRNLVEEIGPPGLSGVRWRGQRRGGLHWPRQHRQRKR